MSEEKEMLLLLKELVDKVKQLEEAVYNEDNILMKSGYVVSNSPVPIMNSSTVDADTISKMDWSEINDMVARIEGGY
tara:strand:+ start:56 stop:286 length:231 start_codon:yes stop_codon:yes gene_type:complete